ncbi:MAG: Ig-like domain-containing protein [Bacteroidia bacterium]
MHISKIILGACILWAQGENFSLQERIRLKEAGISLPPKVPHNLRTAVTGPEQDCPNALPWCANTTFNQPNSYTGYGNVQEVPTTSCLRVRERHTVWFRFQITGGGNLAFTITPYNPSDDYDFALYDITGRSCGDIVTGVAPEVRCNFSADPGPTGLSSAGTNPSEPASGPKWSSVMPVTAGQVYVLVVDNYSQSANGFQLTLNNNNTASIGDNVPPQATALVYSCGSNKVIVQFNEPVRCGDIHPNGSDFIFTAPPGAPAITAATGVNCPNADSYTSQVELTLSGNLTTGTTYTLRIRNGTDGNTLRDQCGNWIPNPTNYNLTVSASSAASITPNSPTICEGQTITLNANPRGTGYTYQWYSNTTCTGTPFATTPSIQVTGGTTSTLNYCVRVTDNCGTSTANTTVTVKLSPLLSALTTNPNPICAGGTVTFTPSISPVGLCGGVSCSRPDCRTGSGAVNCGGFLCGCAAGPAVNLHTLTWLWTGWPNIPNPPSPILTLSLGTNNVNFTLPPYTGSYALFITLCDPVSGCCRDYTYTYNVSCVLPSYEIELRGQKQDRDIHLSWRVNQHIPGQQFLLQRAHASSVPTWQNVAELGESIYTYVDKNVSPGHYLYRVVQILPNQTRLESNVWEMIVDSEGQGFYVSGRVEAAGTPAEITWETFAGSWISWRLYDARGVLLAQEEKELPSSTRSLSIPMPQVSGMYVLQVRVGGQVYAIRLMRW